MAAVRINTRVPKNAVKLHVPSSVYNKMAEAGTWPKGTNSLVYEMQDRVWYIGPDHPDFDRMTAAFGPANPKAKVQWESELKQRDRAVRALSARRVVEVEDRVFLPGLVGQTARARELGALWDRSRKTWYVSRYHTDAQKLEGRYAGQKAGAAATHYHAGRAAADSDKARGATQAPERPRSEAEAAAPTAKRAAPEKEKAPERDKAPDKKPTRRRPRDTGQEH